MDFIFLADKQEMKPVVAKWYFDKWGHLNEGASVASFDNKLNDYLNRDSLPLMIMAVEDDYILGVAQLRYHEMSIYPEKEHWLGGVYVDAKHRGKHVASAIVNKIEQIALTLGVSEIHLQTESLNGGLYARLGWQPVEQVNYHGVDVQVMSKIITA
ncbi:GNAT family N-acetyltransferase [Celerinatantimonas yamalensis]|uniref:GNAT family N-acetyltransferase n=1 Tax=Celerinatantimonas yamalensis TaxID=559956 RepID=A0ABW9G6D6_9GAMM